ncbi:hypothetical protein ACH9D2_07240 [Kocuria sp. M4R2S49]|uniref:hypothetical protein n=1 Tax=Kocuria rhizosphaericola TaxID=3376284 RepID=UPI0037948047
MSTATAVTGMEAFDRTTSTWGRITMLLGLALSLAGPMYLVFIADLGVTLTHVLTAYAAVAATFLIFAVVEPLTYFPILGQAAMYQAFMIGNISNKLLPAAVVAQDSIGVRPGTKKADLSAVMAICGAALVHLTSLLVFVGLLGTWLLAHVPPQVMEVARLYILPAIAGAVLVQAVATMRQPRTTAIALGVALILALVVVPVVPVVGMYTTAVAVALTIALAWILGSRTDRPARDEHDESSGTAPADQEVR